MPLLRSRSAVHHARFKAAVRFFAAVAVVLIVFVVLVTIAYVRKQV
jgi:hypothetical protein